MVERPTPSRGGQRQLGRQPVADAEPGPFDHLRQGIEHGDAARRRIDPLEIIERVAFADQRIGHACKYPSFSPD